MLSDRLQSSLRSLCHALIQQWFELRFSACRSSVASIADCYHGKNYITKYFFTQTNYVNLIKSQIRCDKWYDIQTMMPSVYLSMVSPFPCGMLRVSMLTSSKIPSNITLFSAIHLQNTPWMVGSTSFTYYWYHPISLHKLTRSIINF